MNPTNHHPEDVQVAPRQFAKKKASGVEQIKAHLAARRHHHNMDACTKSRRVWWLEKVLFSFLSPQKLPSSVFLLSLFVVNDHHQQEDCWPPASQLAIYVSVKSL